FLRRRLAVIGGGRGMFPIRCSGLGLHHEEGRRPASAQQDDSRRNGDEQQRQLLFLDGNAFGLFALGAALSVRRRVGDSRKRGVVAALLALLLAEFQHSPDPGDSQPPFERFLVNEALTTGKSCRAPQGAKQAKPPPPL